MYQHGVDGGLISPSLPGVCNVSGRAVFSLSERPYHDLALAGAQVRRTWASVTSVAIWREAQFLVRAFFCEAALIAPAT